MIRRVSASRFVAFGFIILIGNGCAGGDAGSDGVGVDFDTGAAGDTTVSPEDTGSGFEIGGDDTTPATDDTGATTPDTGELDAIEAGTDSAPAETSATDAATDGAGGDASDGTAADSAPADTGPADTGPLDPCSAALSCTDDADGDKIPDSVEGRCAAGGATDTDGDGTPDYLDLDSDGDGIHDRAEWFAGGCDPTLGNDADGDGIPNFRDLDSDNNGLPDSAEKCPPTAVLTALAMPACIVGTPYDFDGDGVPDFIDPENDHDSSSPSKAVGLDDRYELTNKAGVYVGLVDSDGDMIPDLYDVDSDNDGILDADDGINDIDADGKQNFRDTDSDGDGVPDSCEKRVDTDGDGKADYVDLDSDGDLLLDKDEDRDGNCLIGATESDRLKKDSDGDGVDDFIEVTLDTGKTGWATDATKTPASMGKFYFLVPYNADPTPATSTLALETTLQKGDLGIVMDSSYSMNGPFDNLKTNLSSIITTLKTRVPGLGIGLAGHDDIPTAQSSSTSNLYGSCVASPPTIPNVDNPFYLLTAITTDTATATTAVAGYRMGDGWDLPENQAVAILHALNGTGFSWPSLNGCPAGSRAAVADTATSYGAMRFRKDALPIVLSISDAEFHNGRHTTAIMPNNTGVTTTRWFTYNPGVATGNYYLNPTNAYSFATPNITDLATALKAKGARFIGGAADDSRAVRAPSSPPAGYTANQIYVSGPSSGVTGVSAARDRNYGYSAFGDMEYLVDETASYVDPADFTPTAACPIGQCCTGFNGAGIAPDAPGGKCKLVFNVQRSGTGLNTQIVDSVIALLNAIRFDAYVEAVPDPGPVDSVNAFMTAVRPSGVPGTDPVTGKTCIVAPGTADRYNTPKALPGAGDVFETATGIKPGTLYCFDVLPKKNTTVPATLAAQTFTAKLNVWAESPTGKIALGTPREVLFIVPPIAN